MSAARGIGGVPWPVVLVAAAISVAITAGFVALLENGIHERNEAAARSAAAFAADLVSRGFTAEVLSCVPVGGDGPTVHACTFIVDGHPTRVDCKASGCFIAATRGTP